MSILLVRHGETAGNAARIMQRPDVPLNERGLRQAERLAERLAAMGFSHILSSDLPRARMTAEPIARRAGLHIEETPLLQERDFGDLRGTPYAQFRQNPFDPDFVPPNGESWEAFYARVARAFALLVERRSTCSGALVVVTHGLVCAAILQRHVQLAIGHVAPERLDNASLSIFGPVSPHATSLINCTAHLAGGLGPDSTGGPV